MAGRRRRSSDEEKTPARSNLPDEEVIREIARLDKNQREYQSSRASQRLGAHHKRTHALRSADMARISSMLLHGASVDEIAEDLGIERKTVLQDMQEINRLWVKEIAQNNEAMRAVSLSKLMKLEALALESFHESKQRTVTDLTIEPDGGTRRSVKEFHTAGEPAFLNVAKDCIKQQISLLGLDGKEQSVKAFDKDAFLDAVAEKIAEVKVAATAVPTMATELKEVEEEAKGVGLPF